MGQRANSGRQANLDDKKERTQGRAQNDPARKEITGREAPPQVDGASGTGGGHNSEKIGGFRSTGDQTGGSGGEAAMEVEQRLAKDHDK